MHGTVYIRKTVEKIKEQMYDFLKPDFMFENQGIDKWTLWYVTRLSNQTEKLIIDEPWRYSVWDLDIQKSSNFTENFSSQCKVQLYIMHM